MTVLLERVMNAKSVEDLDSETVSRQMKRLAETTVEYSDNKIPEPAASEIISAFLQGHPGAALCRIVELRSGRSLNLESGSHFSSNYLYLLSSFINAMSRVVEVRKEYITSCCARAALLELKSSEFMQHRDKSPTESPTARAISSHLHLIYHVSIWESLRAELGEQLRLEGFFPILKELTKSRSLYFPLTFFF